MSEKKATHLVLSHDLSAHNEEVDRHMRALRDFLQTVPDAADVEWDPDPLCRLYGLRARLIDLLACLLRRDEIVVRMREAGCVRSFPPDNQELALRAGDERTQRLVALVAGWRACWPVPGSSEETLFECRCCPHTARASSGSLPAGWGRLLNVDGPSGVCPACVEKNDVSDFVADGYPNARIARIEGQGAP